MKETFPPLLITVYELNTYERAAPHFQSPNSGETVEWQPLFASACCWIQPAFYHRDGPNGPWGLQLMTSGLFGHEESSLAIEGDISQLTTQITAPIQLDFGDYLILWITGPECATTQHMLKGEVI